MLGHPNYNFPRYLVWSPEGETEEIGIRISAGLGSLEGFPSEKSPLKSTKWNRELLSVLARDCEYLCSSFNNLDNVGLDIIENLEDQTLDEEKLDWRGVFFDGHFLANEKFLYDVCYARTNLDESLTELMGEISAQSGLASFVYEGHPPFRLIGNKNLRSMHIPIWFEYGEEGLFRSLQFLVPGKSTILMHGEKIVAGRFPFGSGFFEAGTAEVGTDVVIETLE